MRRRGIRGLRRGPSQSNRAFDLILQHKLLALRELRGIERPEGTPEWIELGSALVNGSPVAVVAGRRPGVELIGFARIAARLSRDAEAPGEAIVLAPLVSPQMRSAAEWMAARGFAVRLVAWPVLAERPEELVAIERYPLRAQSPGASPLSGILGRVVRVVEGAAAVTCAGEVRSIGDDHVLYMRGVRMLRIVAEGDGVGLHFLEPDKRQVHVNEGNFPRWGPELYEQIVGLAQDPRLIGSSSARESAADASAREAGARIMARWMPWSEDGGEPIDWVGVDASGRPALGFLRERLRMSDVPTIVAALARIGRESDVWTPGARGRARLFVAGNGLTEAVRDLLDDLGVDVETGQRIEETRAAQPEARERERTRDGERMRDGERARDGERGRDAERGRDGEREAGEREGGERERRGRRRSRRRRRGRGDDRAVGERARENGAVAVGRDAEFDESGEPGEWDGPDEGEADDDPRGPRESLRAEPADDDELESRYESRSDAVDSAERDEDDGEDDGDADLDRGRDDSGEARAASFEGEREPELAADAADDLGSDADGDADDPDDDEDDESLEPAEPPAELRAETRPPAPDAESDGGEELEVADAPDAEEIVAVQTAELRAAVRRRRPKAAIAVRNDPDSVLAALVLARERRNVPFFYVCAQHELMDFLRGKATDIDDATDLLLVGFTAQPVPSETIAAAQVYRGPLCWFDHHEWPIEDLERLREAIGPESVFVVDSASSPLAAVVDVAERRSRFTDKLLDFSARRLSENDMQKWGYRLAGAIGRMAGASGDHRQEIQAILAGKPSDLPAADQVYEAEETWLKTHEPRVVCFGEYQMAVGIVPEALDAGEVGRRLRLLTGARLSLSARAGDSVVLVGYNEEKRHMNVQGLLEQLEAKVSWLHARPSGDRIGRLEIDDLAQHPERIEAMIGEIVRHKSVLYG